MFRDGEFEDACVLKPNPSFSSVGLSSDKFSLLFVLLSPSGMRVKVVYCVSFFFLEYKELLFLSTQLSIL